MEGAAVIYPEQDGAEDDDGPGWFVPWVYPIGMIAAGVLLWLFFR